MSDRLLADHEPPPVLAFRREGTSPIVLMVDHASARIPRRLGDLGLPASELRRHTAWDIGALAVARQVAAILDAPLVAQNYSRLVIDCNRNPLDATCIPKIAESIEIPGNRDLTEAQITVRRKEIFEPYHEYLRLLIEERVRARRPTLLLAQHSMTDVLQGVRRPMHCAVMYNDDCRLSDLLLRGLREDHSIVVADNEPYSGKEGSSYTLRYYGEMSGFPHAQIEIRQDLILTSGGQTDWARRIAEVLRRAAEELVGNQEGQVPASPRSSDVA